MIKRLITIVFPLSLIANFSYSQKKLPYQVASLKIEQRVEDLLSRMTVEEKVGQLCQYVGPSNLRRNENMYKEQSEWIDADDNTANYKNFTATDLEEYVKKGWTGSFLNVEGEHEINALQKLAMQSRLKIPLLIGTDAIHGHSMYEMGGATIFPSPIGISSTWDLTMARKIAEVTKREMRATGYHWTFSPNVDVARDARWGRVGETFGEDPWLVEEFGAAFINGYQGKDFGEKDVLACAKHFIAGSEPPNGKNFAPMDVSERRLREVWFPPYERAVKEGVYTFMAAHNEINGVPCHANRYLMTDILRNEWNFRGFVVSDWTDIARLHTLHKVATSIGEANRLALMAGLDMHMHGPSFFLPVVNQVKNGTIPMSVIDNACRKILYAKFKLGLFEKVMVDKNTAKKTLFQSEAQNLALEAARKSIVLLKNDKNILPLDKKIKTIFITGPNANNQSILGDWAMIQPEKNIVTILEGIQQIVSPSTVVDYYDCGKIQDVDQSDVTEAAARAAKADVAIIVVGENSLRSQWNERTAGENLDRADIDLVGKQQQMVEAVYQTGTPTLAVLVNGRPLSIEWIAKHVPAIVEAWEPGSLGGQAVAETIFGDNNPSGKLTVTFPRSAGHIESVYNHKAAHHFRSYPFTSNKPIWEFGHGLSYTSFQYNNLKVDSLISPGEEITIHVDVTNTGQRAGDEVVMAFVNDVYSSVTTPVRELKSFQRISLQAGETTTVTLSIPYERLSLLDVDLKRVVEPGEFELYVGDQKSMFNVIAD